MNYLAIDTCGSNLTVILSYNGQEKYIYEENCGVNHSIRLMPAIEQLKEELDADFSKLNFVAVVVGAGSFTGIRIGISTAKAIAFSFNLPIKAITSFETLSYNKLSGKYLAVVDAMHESFYVCGFTNNKITFEPKFIDKNELLVLEKEYKLISSTQLDNIESEKVSILEGLQKACLNKDELLFDLSKVEPLYIRKSQAEEGR